METTVYTHDDEKQLATEAEIPPVTDAKSPKAEPPPPASKPKAKATKVTPKKQYPGDLDADAKKLVALYAKEVKPKRLDNSGSVGTFTDTAKRLLANGASFADLELAARNYAAVRMMEERKEKDPEDQIKFRHGFQTFYGPKYRHWKDCLGETLEVIQDQPAKGSHPESTGEVQRMMRFFKKAD